MYAGFAHAQIAPLPITVNSYSETAPPLILYKASPRTIRVTHLDGTTPTDLTGLTPVLTWATNDTAGGIVTSSVSIVSATGGVFDATFSAAQLNYTGGRYLYEVGVAPTVTRQGVMTLNNSPYGSGVGAVTFGTNVNWGLVLAYLNAGQGPGIADGITISQTTNSNGQLVFAMSGVLPVISADIDMGGYIATNYGTPSASDHVVDKGYMDTSIAAADVANSNGITTAWQAGDVANSNGITTAYTAADVVVLSNANAYTDTSITSYSNIVDGLLAGYLPLAGGDLTGDLGMGGNTITNLADPVNAQDAATKAYGDANWTYDWIDPIISAANQDWFSITNGSVFLGSVSNAYNDAAPACDTLPFPVVVIGDEFTADLVGGWTDAEGSVVIGSYAANSATLLADAGSAAITIVGFLGGRGGTLRTGTTLYGARAGEYLSGYRNTAVGFSANASTSLRTAYNDSTCVGTYAGYGAPDDTLPACSFLGAYSGYNYDDAIGGSVGVGFEALRDSDAEYSVGVGYEAMDDGDGEYGVALGYQSAWGSDSTYSFFGAYQSGYGADGTYNVGVGSRALKNATNARYVNAIGEQAAQLSANCKYVDAIGWSAGGTAACTNGFFGGAFAGFGCDSNFVNAIGSYGVQNYISESTYLTGDLRMQDPDTSGGRVSGFTVYSHDDTDLILSNNVVNVPGPFVVDDLMCEQLMDDYTTQAIGIGQASITGWVSNVEDAGFDRTTSNITVLASGRYTISLAGLSFETANASQVECYLYTNEVKVSLSGGLASVGWDRTQSNLTSDGVTSASATLTLPANTRIAWWIETSAAEDFTWNHGTFRVERK
jgi:hypothetical protein